MPETCDILVIGGGPGGGTAALLLARAGFDVAILERKPFPRRKVCGEYLSSTNRPLFQRLGLLDAFDDSAGPEIHQVGLFAGEVVLAAGLSQGGKALSRERLDTLLMNRAASAGVRIHQPCAAQSLRRDGEHFLVRCLQMETRRDFEVQARLVVAAHGSWDVGALPTQEPKRLRRPDDLLAFKAHFRGDAMPADMMSLLSLPGGYGGMVRTDSDRLSLSCCIRRDRLQALGRGGMHKGEALLQLLRSHCRGARMALAGARQDGPWLAAGPINPGIRLESERGLFRVGNAAGEAHPVIAEGISMAMQGAWLLAERLSAWKREGMKVAALDALAADYARAWRRAFAPRLRAATIIAHWVSRPALVAVTLPVLRTFPALLSVWARLSGKNSKVVAP